MFEWWKAWRWRGWRYVPVALLGALVVAWVLSFVWEFGVVVSDALAPNHFRELSVERGVVAYRLENKSLPSDAWFRVRPMGRQVPFFPPTMAVLGGLRFQVFREFGRVDGANVEIPFACLITLLLPLAVGSFTGFRFRLWHWLAYTALVAAGLAFYVPRAVISEF